MPPRVVAPGWKPSSFVLDVDGVLTNGQFLYTVDGKVGKLFGADDHDALLLLKPHLEIRFITGDKKGFPISHKRIVEDMKFPLDLVSTVQRARWFREHTRPADAVYMGDGIFDPYVFPHVGYAICPGDGHPAARARADHVTAAGGGDRAVAEACLHLLERFFEPFDPDRQASLGGGEWGQ